MGESGRSTEIVIPKEQAVFWMDGAGRWHNRHGQFTHKKIIDHFNASIQNDDNGYFLTQDRGDIIEKVYFPHAETALFAVDLIFDDPVMMKLNNGSEIKMITAALFIFKDDLYYRMDQQLVKFNQRALLKISEKMTYECGRYVFEPGSGPIQIEVREDIPSPKVNK